MLEDAKTCKERGCRGCEMHSTKRFSPEDCVEALAAALDEERKLHRNIIAIAPEKACRYSVVFYDKKGECLGLDKYTIPRKSPEDIIIEKHGESAREILDEYKALLKEEE